MKRPPAPRDQRQEIGMTAMIDVVFLLLMFFLWTSSFDEPERDLPAAVAMSAVAMPAASEMPPQGGTPDNTSPQRSRAAPTAPTENEPGELVDELILAITRQPDGLRWTLGTTSLNTAAALEARLRQIAAIGVEPPVIIDPSGDVPMADVIAAFDLARHVGFRRVLFAVER